MAASKRKFIIPAVYVMITNFMIAIHFLINCLVGK